MPVEDWESTLEGKKLAKTYAQNTEEKISLTDLVGNVAQAEVKVENIDKEIPNILVTYEKTEDSKIQVTLVSNEELQEQKVKKLQKNIQIGLFNLISELFIKKCNENEIQM